MTNFTKYSITRRETVLPNLNWKALECKVRSLQNKIAVAYTNGDKQKVAKLQRILTGSFAAQMLAMRSVILSEGIKSPGIDGLSFPTAVQFWMIADMLALIGSSPALYQASPVRRVWIPKNVLSLERDRPLGIPTVLDRCVQVLYLLALDPIAEVTAEDGSYGFRSGLGTWDAITRIYTYLHLGFEKRPLFVYDADIAKFFDTVSHEWLLNNIPLHPEILAQFLKAGFIDQDKLHNTDVGFPQGGNISPTIANMALDGLIAAITTAVKALKPSYYASVNTVRYADDFVTTFWKQFQLDSAILPAIQQFLLARGLRLNLAKSKTVAITDGFDFLGVTLRYVKNYLKPGTWMWLIVPAEKRIKIFKENVAAIFREARNLSARKLFMKLNPVLQGWANYYKYAHSSKTFSMLDGIIWRMYFKWCIKKYPRASMKWIFEHCFKKTQQGYIPCYKPGTSEELCLYLLRNTKLERYGKPRKGKSYLFSKGASRTWKR